MSKILTASGQAMDHVASDTKKAHDPEDLAKERVRLNNILQNAFQDWLKDVTPNPEHAPVVQVDEDALLAHHLGKFHALADAMNGSSFPHQVDRDALYKIVRQYQAQEKFKREMQLPMREVPDLTPYDMLPIGEIADGTLWINTHAAVCVSETGMVQVWLRGKHESLEHWASGWLPKPWRMMVVESMDYKLGELSNLLASMRIARANMGRLNEQQMNACRQPQISARRRWFDL